MRPYEAERRPRVRECPTGRCATTATVYHMGGLRHSLRTSRCAPWAERRCCAAMIGSMIGGRRSLSILERECRSCSRPRLPAACRSPPGSPSRTSCGRSGARGAELEAAQARRHPARAQAAGGRRHRHRHRRRAVAPAFRARLSRNSSTASISRSKVEMGIRADRYKAMVPTVTGALRLKGRVHADEARLARAHTTRKLKLHAAGPDDHRRHHRRRALRRPGEDGDGVRRRCSTRRRARSRPTASTSSSSTSRRSTSTWTRSRSGAIEALHRAIEGVSPARPRCTSATATASRPISTGRRRSAASGGNTRRFFRRWPQSRIDQVSVECRNSRVPMHLLKLLEGKDVLVGVIDVATDEVETPRGGRRRRSAKR